MINTVSLVKVDVVIAGKREVKLVERLDPDIFSLSANFTSLSPAIIGNIMSCSDNSSLCVELK